MNETTRSAVNAWLADPAIADADKTEIHALVAAENHAELADRFARDLEFGTGGLRGILGAGRNRMNRYTVGAAAQGLADYIRASGTSNPSIAIACDCRRQSDTFSKHVACIMAANGITAHLFSAPRPTPHLSFAVRTLGCTAGVVVTASHNPPEYNGFKAYWSDGAQVVPPQDAGIITAVRAVGSFANIRTVSFDDAVRDGRIRILGGEMDEKFLSTVQSSCLAPDECRSQGRAIKIVYTSLHGTGGTLIPQALRQRGFEHVFEVREQAELDGEFPTVASPNPEEGPALKMAIDLAKRENADLVIGTDPDADRVGIAVRKPDGDFALLSGNQTGALLTNYLCERLTRLGRWPSRPVVLSTIVSGALMKTIARHYGAEVEETLTGFKWIAERIRLWELEKVADSHRRRYIFGAEESYGYMPTTYVRDKDAVTSAAMIAEMAAVARSEGRTLYTLLDDLYRQFGYHQEGAKSITMPGVDGSQRIAALMQSLRTNPPRAIGGIDVVTIGDLQTGDVRNAESSAVIQRFDLPQSEVLIYTLTDGTKVIARPSGTEPKIKFYILTQAPGDDLTTARSLASQKIEAISADLTKLAK
ncbi:MAG: phospho-sugar mutase [Planctomycetes bacterium]|nr:phospho-sugar mutase [Planctomycetota bacterium]